MPEENQPPNKDHRSYKDQARMIPNEIIQAAKSDWLTGQFNTAQLADKYKIERGSLIAHLRFRWMKEARALGITWSKEPHYERRSYGSGTWKLAKLDFLAGKTLDDLSSKYGIPKVYLNWKTHQLGWWKERNQLFNSTHAKIQNNVNSQAGQIVAKYEAFVNVAIPVIDSMTDKLKVMVEEGTCTPDRLKTMVDTMGGLVTNMMKICGVEKSTTQVNNQFIRLDVLDSSATATMNHLAKTIDLKAS